VLPTGLGEDQFFAGGAKSLSAYQQLYPGLAWTNFLAAWTQGQATTPYVDQGENRLENYLAWDPGAAAQGVDIDLWLLEPSGNLYIPYLGSVTPNGNFTGESSTQGVAYEGWLTHRYLQVGAYGFYANLWSDPAQVHPIVQVYYRHDQVSSLTPLYAAGSEPQLSLTSSWLADPTPTFGEADAGFYTDLRLVATLAVSPQPNVAAMDLRRTDKRSLTPQVVAGHVGNPAQVQGNPISTFMTRGQGGLVLPKPVAPAITAAQLATARRLLTSRGRPQPRPAESIRRLP